ncbi:MAG TPA: CoA transferase [Mycobacterium sp.]|nr:CoA transferase [Mycobacterium sp.]
MSRHRRRQRVACADALEKEIDALLSDRLAAEVLIAMDDAGVPAGRIRTVPELYDGVQVRTSMVLTLAHPTLGDLDVPAPPLQLSDGGEPRRDAPPALGADLAHVFADYAPVRGGR